MTDWPALDVRDTDRYGVFLRPDARTCEVLAHLHDLLRRQFGLVAAAVFPPHITLLGNIAVVRGEADLLARVGAAVAGHGPFEITNPGPALVCGALLCEVHTEPVGDPGPQRRDGAGRRSGTHRHRLPDRADRHRDVPGPPHGRGPGSCTATRPRGRGGRIRRRPAPGFSGLLHGADGQRVPVPQRHVARGVVAMTWSLLASWTP